MEKLKCFKTSVLGFGCFVFVEKLTQLNKKLDTTQQKYH